MKRVFLGLFFIVFSTVCYSQTWQESAGVNNVNIHEYTVITTDQYDRLLRQYEGRFTFATFSYIDVLEMGNNVISGTRPRFNGYYYLMGVRKTAVGEIAFLAYGNSSTGRFELAFPGYMTTAGSGGRTGFRIGSNEYINRYNQHISWVNGK